MTYIAVLLLAFLPVLATMLGASIGSVATGHPLVSYILGGAPVAEGVSLLAVTTMKTPSTLYKTESDKGFDT